MIVDILAFVFIIAVCVVIHEYGHYRTAIACGVQVHEFSFGMGPAIYSFKGKRNLWSVRAFPIGGFVRLAGMEEDNEDEIVTPGMGFNEKSPSSRLAILFAGPLSNVLLAFFLTALLLWGHGILDMERAKIGTVMDGYPAQSAGLMPGDLVLSVGGEAVENWPSMAERIRTHDVEKPLVLRIERGDEIFSLSLSVPKDPATGYPLLGIQPGRVRFSSLESVKKSISYTFAMTLAMVRGLFSWIVGQNQVDVSGPVGIASMAGQAAKQGGWALLSFLAIISLNLGIVNLFPFPALDGGRIVFILGEILTGKKLPEKVEGYVHFTGFVILIGLIAFITWQDILRLLAR
ncbi:RIP metalloprotease RseP [Dethiosulfovibrio sp. F2B]|uniref:RIP metalloprotease RseP n=1 Tax=Dethiosulfovibrio faecalis TaxID=2720018 RepID=UPI001F237EF3|nr:RIP metalloprotease RseP [Dethiosulfovibrio faecalis]MCF4150488.1 RIP metalloprotease RseP [Dethiosulfovibrio faecalis]